MILQSPELTFVVVAILIPFFIIYVWGVLRFVLACCELIGDFIDALKWRMWTWISSFKYSKDK